MSDESAPFELEPEDEPPPSKPVRRRVPSSDLPSRAAPPLPPAIDREPLLEGEVDTRTVAERLGKPQPPATEVLPPPDGWPLEALAFPLRSPGPRLIVTLGALLVGLDVLRALPAASFPVLVLQLLLLTFVLRGQLHVVATSAAGRDAPVGWRQALELDYERLRSFGRLVLWLALWALPVWLTFAYGSLGAGLVVFVFGTMYAAVILLSGALGDPALARPWNALAWIGRRPIACFVGGCGLLALGASEVLLVRAAEGHGIGLLLVASLGLRPACVYVLLVSARALGVVGRSWTG